MDKRAVLDQILEQLRREIDVLTEAAQATREGATHEEAKPENDKDTRAIEASYLAGAQAERVRELRSSLISLESLRLEPLPADAAVRAGALVVVEVDGSRGHYLLAPQGGGMRAQIGGIEVQLLTPRSPLGGALLGRTVGDVVEVVTQRARREYEIVAVH